jgi:hypothetical protein
MLPDKQKTTPEKPIENSWKSCYYRNVGSERQSSHLPNGTGQMLE